MPWIVKVLKLKKTSIFLMSCRTGTTTALPYREMYTDTAYWDQNKCTQVKNEGVYHTQTCGGV